jgi:Uma2 family endonuclease
MLTDTLVADKKYSVEEYFELEKTSEIRHEFINGEIIAMPGESKKANKIAQKIVRLLEDKINSKVFDIFNHYVRLMLENNRYRYPDIIVAPTIDDEDSHAITQPVLIVEVFS